MQQLTQQLYEEIVKIPVLDPHSHIDPARPTAADLDDLLGYHYYTELAHSAGLERKALGSEVPAEERSRAIARWLPAMHNTAQYGWLLEIARNLFSFPHDRIDSSNIQELWDLAERFLTLDGWAEDLRGRSRLEKVFLTNTFDDPLEGFDTEVYVPCLRLDDLVFQLGDSNVVERLRQASQADVGNATSLVEALRTVFQRFKERGAKACAISLPPDFVAKPRGEDEVDRILRRLLSGEGVAEEENRAVSQFVFWTAAQLCGECDLPFNLMIGVIRDVYPDGVHQGRDLFDNRLSLYSYQALFNAFGDVVFPVSVLPANLNQELVSYSWIFPNVVTLGHWWYSNTPSLIEADTRARLEAVPRTKQIGYYSDAYKLEFILPKFNMYRRILARVLAQDFVVARGWKEEDAVALARDLLHDNIERIYFGA
jgi:glucuronate isomerase